MRFSKIHELGNDYVLFDGRDVDPVDWSVFCRRVCDRRTGVGADGVLFLLRSAVADVRMRLFDPDGCEVKTVGGGIRAFARYVFAYGVVRGTEFSVETASGVVRPRILLKNGRVDAVCFDMGVPVIDAKDIPVALDGQAINRLLTVEERSFPFTAVRVGTPHAVVFDDAANDTDVAHYGSLIERDPLFPEGVSVNFAEVLSNGRIRIRTWKRGVGSVPASASGACAAAVACALSGKTDRTVSVESERGSVLVEWSETDGHMRLTGPAEFSFSGNWNN